MTNETIAFTPDQGSAEQISGSEVQADQAQGGEPQVSYVTVDQIQALKSEIASQKEELTRQMQSLTDKAESRISKQVREQVAVLKEVERELEGLPANVQQAVRDRVYNEAFASVKGVEVDTNQAQVDSDFNRRIEMLGGAILETAGVTLEQSDPEFKTLVLNKSAEEYLDSITKAAKAKKQRMATGETAPEVGSPQSRLPNLAVGSSTHGEVAIREELNNLLSKSQMTVADRKRANELEVELKKYVK